ncbi:hypothetical protein HYH03_000792 [Edaphochlamys debaryana]|uniref:peptidylprolyl isomerase n=1 Tax=Edaphochlamys debaryana TaxID=47281 RepID=A0A835YDN3_9CHLO|nr:hypothetical protein HYH03_000792 [Edaphochlamys debaryana]|eukprot:KAG2500970.1 hypothetical protein HYH03_000792 [Edaphochlamys debaryana]
MFMDTRTDKETEEPMVVVAGRDTAATETGLCLAAATMAKGERALVYVLDPLYGYGARGSFSFPCVPPSAQLVYELEMLSWEGIEEGDTDRDRGSLLYEERMERAERRRLAGNELFKEGRWKDALAKYAMALSYMDEDFIYQLDGHYLDKAEKLKVLVHLNMAACQLKTEDYNTAIYNCGQVLNMDPKNVKALFRRGKARLALGRTEEAKEDLEAARKLDPSDAGIIAELRLLAKVQGEEKKAQEQLFKGKIAAPVAASSSSSAPAAAASASAAADGASAPSAAASASAADATERSGGAASTSAASAAAAGGGQPSKRAAAAAKGPRQQQDARAAAAAAKSTPASRKAVPERHWLVAMLLGWLASLLAIFGVRLGAKAQKAGRAR